MLTPEAIRSDIESIISDLIKISLSVDQTFPSQRNEGNEVKIDFGKSDISIALKNKPYKEIYDELFKTKSYNFKFIDGALVHLMYIFENERIKKHRLAFFPSPYLEEFQNNSEIYENDEIYADIISEGVKNFV